MLITTPQTQTTSPRDRHVERSDADGIDLLPRVRTSRRSLQRGRARVSRSDRGGTPSALGHALLVEPHHASLSLLVPVTSPRPDDTFTPLHPGAVHDAYAQDTEFLP